MKKVKVISEEKEMVYRYGVLPQHFDKLVKIWEMLGISWHLISYSDGEEREYDLTGTESALVKFLVKAYRMSEGEAKKMLKGAK